MFALPAGILSSGLAEAVQKKKLKVDKSMDKLDTNKTGRYSNINKKIKRLEKMLKNVIVELESLKKMSK